MGNFKDGILYYEAGRAFESYELLTDAGEHTIFESSATLFSADSDIDAGVSYDVVVAANGVLTGLIGTPAVSGTDDLVDTSAGTLNLNGVPEYSVSADTDLTMTRGATQDYIVNSVTIDNGGSIVAIAGTEGASPSETRGAAGGPPFIPVDSVEIYQVRLTSQVAAPITSDEIFAVPNLHRELALNPSPSVLYGRQSNNVLLSAAIQFASALQLNHTGGVAKRVYAQYYTPTFSEWQYSKDIQFPSLSGTGTSAVYYNNAVISSVDTSINDGSFVFATVDGITESWQNAIGRTLWFKFLPNKLKTSQFYLTQGQVFWDQGPHATEGNVELTAALVGKTALRILG